jgi:hypothetical protein
VSPSSTIRQRRGSRPPACATKQVVAEPTTTAPDRVKDALGIPLEPVDLGE